MEGKQQNTPSESSNNSVLLDLVSPPGTHQKRISMLKRQASDKSPNSSKYSFNKNDEKAKKAAIIYPAPHPDYDHTPKKPPPPQLHASTENNPRSAGKSLKRTASSSSDRAHRAITRQHAYDIFPVQEDQAEAQMKSQNVEKNYRSTCSTSEANEKDALLPDNQSCHLTENIVIEKPSQELNAPFRLLYHYRIKEALLILFLFILVMIFTIGPHFMGDGKACEEGYFKCVVTKTNKYEADYKCCQNGDTCCRDAAGYGSCCSPGSVCCSGACCSKLDKKCCGDVCIPLDYDCCLAGVYCSQYYKCCIASSIVQCCQDNVVCSENTFCGQAPSRYK